MDSIRNCASVGHIEDIAVAADQQGKRLGLRIIQALDAIAQQVGCYKSILDCSEKNQGFYEKCGFKLAGVQMVRRYRRGYSCFDFVFLASGADFDRRTTMKTNKLFGSGVCAVRCWRYPPVCSTLRMEEAVLALPVFVIEGLKVAGYPVEVWEGFYEHSCTHVENYFPSTQPNIAYL